MKYFPKICLTKSLALCGMVMFYGDTSALVIEDFTQQPRLDRLTWTNPGASAYTEVLAGYALGGERDFGFSPVPTTLPSSFYRELTPAAENIGKALKMVGFGPPPGNFRVQATMTLQYDGTGDEGQTGYGQTLNDGGTGSFSLPSNVGGIRLFARPDGSLPLNVAVILRRQGQLVAENTQLLPNGVGDQLFYFPFSQNELSLCDSVSVELRFDVVSNQVQGLDLYRIDTIVPEPGTYLALGGGLVWLLRRRVHKGATASGWEGKLTDR